MRTVDNDSRNIDETAENQKNMRPLLPVCVVSRVKYVNLIICLTRLIGFGHSRQDSGDFELRGIEASRLLRLWSSQDSATHVLTQIPDMADSLRKSFARCTGQRQALKDAVEVTVC